MTSDLTNSNSDELDRQDTEPHNELPDSVVFRLEELLDQWEDAQESGNPLSSQELCAACPDLLEPLEAKIAAIKKVNAYLEQSHHMIAPDRPNPGKPNPVSIGLGLPGSYDRVPSSVKFDSSFVDLQLHERGGIGLVYRAVDLNLNRDVAIKFIQPRHARNENISNRFQQEAEITGRLDHPGVVPVYALGHTEDGQPFYSMRFIRGDSLDDAITSFHKLCGHVEPDKCRLELRKMLANFVSVCRTIAYAHTRGIVHRDIKPQNVMLGKYGEALVVDWGLALPIDRDSKFRVSGETTLRPTLAKTIEADMGEGTPVYMSPEQVAGREQIMPASDIFSLGVTMYKLLTGELAFGADTAREVRKQIIDGEFILPRKIVADIAPDLQSICLKAMANDPARRYETASDLADDIEHWLADGRVNAHQYTPTEKLGRWCRNHQEWAWSVAAGLVAVCFATIVGALLFLMSTNDRIRLQGDAEHALQLANRSQADNLRMTCEVMSQSIASSLESKMLALEEVASTPELIRWLDVESPFENRLEIEAILETARSAELEDDAVMSWFALDSKGNLLARSSDNSSIVAKNQPRWTRPYFHGGETNLDLAEYKLSHGDELPAPINRTYLSPVFDALQPTGDATGIESDRQRLYSLSAPIKNKDQIVTGVIGVTLRAGMLQPLKRMRSATGERYVSLIESRGEHSGTLVDHTGWQGERERSTPNSAKTNNYVECDKALLAQLMGAKTDARALGEERDPRIIENYCDPNEGAFAGSWIAFSQPIFIKSRMYGETNCGWHLVVQDRPFEMSNSAN